MSAVPVTLRRTVDLEIDGMARLDPAVELEATAAGHRAGRDHGDAGPRYERAV